MSGKIVKAIPLLVQGDNEFNPMLGNYRGNVVAGMGTVLDCNRQSIHGHSIYIYI